MGQLEMSFKNFAKIVPEKEGLVVGCADCNETVKILSVVDRNKVTFGIENEADFMAKNIAEMNGILL